MENLLVSAMRALVYLSRLFGPSRLSELRALCRPQRTALSTPHIDALAERSIARPHSLIHSQVQRTVHHPHLHRVPCWSPKVSTRRPFKNVTHASSKHCSAHSSAVIMIKSCEDCIFCETSEHAGGSRHAVDRVPN